MMADAGSYRGPGSDAALRDDLLRDAITLIIDSYALLQRRMPDDLRVGTGPRCCGTETTVADMDDAQTLGGRHDPEASELGRPIVICICRPKMQLRIGTDAGYDRFVRIIGHEWIHVPQHASGAEDSHQYEFDAYHWELCGEGRAPRLPADVRERYANAVLNVWRHYDLMDASLQTAHRTAKRDELRRLLAARGVGPCI